MFNILKRRNVYSGIFSFFAKDNDFKQYTVGLNETIDSYLQGSIKQLILWENLQFIRVVANKKDTDTEEVFYLKEISQEFKTDYDISEEMSLIDWFIEDNNSNGDRKCEIFIVSDSTLEGNQFVKSFDGIGSVLLYKVKNSYEDEENEFEDFNDNDFI